MWREMLISHVSQLAPPSLPPFPEAWPTIHHAGADRVAFLNLICGCAAEEAAHEVRWCLVRHVHPPLFRADKEAH